VAGGLRAFAVEQTSGPVAMRTRLEPLAIPKDGLDSKALFVQTKIDPTDPPRALAMELEAEGRRLEVVWGDAAAIPESGAKRLVAGPLPASNDWTRLEASLAGPAGEIAGRAAAGVSFRVDRGRLVLDRPGWLARGSETVDTPVDTPVGDVAASRQDDGTWLTSVTVNGPRLATVEFRSSQGHPSLPRPAVEIVPTVDRPPSLVVHEPQDGVVLEAPIDVELVAEAFDDWGLDEIGFQSGPDAEHLGARTPLAGIVLADRPPDLRRDLREVIRGDALGLAAGRTIAWRLYVRDTKGQITDGPVRKISVARPPEHALADSQVPAAREAAREAKRAADEAVARKPSLEEQREKVLEAAGEEPLARIDDAQAAAEAATRAEQAAAEQAKQEKNPEAQQAADQARDEARQQAADAAKDAQATTEEAVAAFEDPAKQALAAADTQLEAQRADAARLAEAVAKAAEQAKQSPLVPEAQAQALEALAKRAAKLEEALAKDHTFAGETAKVERLADAPTSEEVAREAEAIGEAVEQLAEAVDAAGAAQRLAALAEDLGNRAETLEALASAARAKEKAGAPQSGQPQVNEQAAGQEPASQKPDGQQPADSQPAASPEAGSKPDQATGDMPPQEAGASQQASEQATQEPEGEPAGAEPAGGEQAGEMAAEPGAAAEPSPLEQAAQEQLGQLERILGTEPAAAEQSAAEPGASEQAGGEAAGAEQAGESPQQPGGEPAAGEAMQEQGGEPASGEPASGEPASGEPASGEPAAQAPLGDSLAAGAEAAREAAATAAELAAAVAEQAAAAAQPKGDSQAAEALAQTLGGEQVQEALAMAERARALAAMQAAAEAAAAQQGQPSSQPAGQQPGQTGTQPGPPVQQPGQQAGMQQGPAGRGPNVNDLPQTSPVGIADADRRGLDPATRAAIEKLPPHVRDPLLEGMRERGPEAYRGVIEAYFKRLGQEIPR
jgi:hypothetical protein